MTEHIPHMIVFGYDDWHGLYEDGKLVTQGHSIRVYDLIGAAKGRAFTLEEPSVSEGWWRSVAYDGDPLPYNYDEIPKEAFA